MADSQPIGDAAAAVVGWIVCGHRMGDIHAALRQHHPEADPAATVAAAEKWLADFEINTQAELSALFLTRKVILQRALEAGAFADALRAVKSLEDALPPEDE